MTKSQIRIRKARNLLLYIWYLIWAYLPFVGGCVLLGLYMRMGIYLIWRV